MKSTAHRQTDCPAARSLRRSTQCVDALRLARTTDLPRAVIIDRPYLAKIGAKAFHRRRIQFQYCRHAARVQCGLPVHAFSPQENQTERLFVGKNPCKRRGGNFSQRKARNRVRHNSCRPQRNSDGKICQKQCRLCIDCASEQRTVRFTALSKADTCDSGADFLSHGENLCRLRNSFDDVLPHADVLGALPCKQKRCFSHQLLLFLVFPVAPGFFQ